MVVPRVPRVGDIYWLENCLAPIRGESLKKRPVIILSCIPKPKRPWVDFFSPWCMHVSVLIHQTISAIELPSHPLKEELELAWRKKTWAVLQWALLIHSAQLGDYAGYISERCWTKSRRPSTNITVRRMDVVQTQISKNKNCFRNTQALPVSFLDGTPRLRI